MSVTEVTELVEPTFDNSPADEADTSIETAPSDVTTDAGTEQATPDASEQDPQRSLTTDQPTTPKEPLKDPFEKAITDSPARNVAPAPYQAELEAITKDPARLQRFINLEKLNGQQSNELGQLRKVAAQWEGLDRQQVDTVLQAQQRAVAESKLQPWNRDHPQNRDFSQLRERRRIDDNRLARVAPEQREAVRQALEADYTPEELDQLKSHEGWRRKEDSLSPEDREDRMRETARTEARAEIQQLLQYQQQTQATQAFIAQHPDLLTKNQELLSRAMDPRTPRSQLAAEIAAKDQQIAELLGQKSKDGRVVSTARAQIASGQQAAVVGRDGARPRQKGDPVAEALRRAAHEGHDFDAFDMLVQASEEPADPTE